eukprot:TRINITY_DN6020_c0_g1_i4.p1 TRINITY_DN6020_c0_g1~~TRINITY_DN6020_c0_g1_i4.p1  ORF type:complete len:1428 (+),score=244.29 TRINITY_DN6020_c0_g1_i4:170-4453(+)
MRRSVASSGDKRQSSTTNGGSTPRASTSSAVSASPRHVRAKRRAKTEAFSGPARRNLVSAGTAWETEPADDGHCDAERARSRSDGDVRFHVVKCEDCGRTVAQEKLEQHKKTCKGKGGNVLVVCRIRPTSKKEAGQQDGIQVNEDQKSLVLLDAGNNVRPFAVDEVFDSRPDAKAFCSQEFFYERVGKQLAEQFLKGINTCIFAYGHTGTGKTYTMLGDGHKESINITGGGAGLLPRFINEVFETNQQEAGSNVKLRYTAMFYEVYNETIRDLLAGETSNRQRVVRVHPKHGVLIEGICTEVVKSFTETLDLVHFGNQMRTVATTTMNERSSRSHAIFSFRFERVQEACTPADAGAGGGEPQTGSRCESTVTFVDLAGREDQTVTMNKDLLHREMCYINTSLFHLAHLITRLSEGKQMGNSLAEFRNSKLTLLLSQALGGNSKTALVATLAPPVGYFADSVSTLNFAQAVKKIKTQPVVNNKSTRNVINELESELKKLREQLQDAKNEKSGLSGDLAKETELSSELQAAQAMIAYYKESWENAVQKSSQQGEARRRMSLALGLTPLGIAQDDKKPLSPFLTKLSDDSSLQGCCNYFLNKRSLTVGSDHSCDVCIQGVGVKKHMCEVRYMHDGQILVDLLDNPESSSSEDEDAKSDLGSGLCSSSSSSRTADKSDDEDPRVLVNGRQISSMDSTPINHGDSIVIGYAHAFRLVIPTEEREKKAGKKDPTILVRSCIECLDSSSAIDEFTDDAGLQFKELHPYLKTLHTRPSLNAVQNILTSTRKACTLIDEANELTKAVLGRSEMYFRLQVLANVFDAGEDSTELVVCVLQKQSYVAASTAVGCRGGSGRRGSLLPALRSNLCAAAGLAGSDMGLRDPVLYVWSMEKFLARLDIMREAYAEGCTGPDSHDFTEIRHRLRAKPFLNPWREMSFADVKTELELLEQLATDGAGFERDRPQNLDAVGRRGSGCQEYHGALRSMQNKEKGEKARVRVVSADGDARSPDHVASKERREGGGASADTSPSSASMTEQDVTPPLKEIPVGFVSLQEFCEEPPQGMGAVASESTLLCQNSPRPGARMISKEAILLPRGSGSDGSSNPAMSSRQVTLEDVANLPGGTFLIDGVEMTNSCTQTGPLKEVDIFFGRSSVTSQATMTPVLGTLTAEAQGLPRSPIRASTPQRSSSPLRGCSSPLPPSRVVRHLVHPPQLIQASSSTTCTQVSSSPWQPARQGGLSPPIPPSLGLQPVGSSTPPTTCWSTASVHGLVVSPSTGSRVALPVTTTAPTTGPLTPVSGSRFTKLDFSEHVRAAVITAPVVTTVTTIPQAVTLVPAAGPAPTPHTLAVAPAAALVSTARCEEAALGSLAPRDAASPLVMTMRRSPSPIRQLGQLSPVLSVARTPPAATRVFERAATPTTPAGHVTVTPHQTPRTR